MSIELLKNGLKNTSTIEEQIIILKDRGLIIDDEEKATFLLRLGKKDKNIFKDNEISINKASKQLFAYIIVMKKMVIDDAVWKTFMDHLNNLIEKYPFVRLDYYGFTSDWKKIIGINETI